MPKKNANELTRIYQGRVLKVTRQGRELRWEEGQKLIWQFHQLFQDAVNYYLLALAGMADDADNSPISRMRRSMKNAWKPFTRNGKVRDGMRESIARVLHCAPNGLTMESAIKQILGEPLAGKSAWNWGVKQIAEACEGNVVKPAGHYLPQLCKEKYKGLFDLSAEMNDGRKGIREVLALINEKDRTVIEKKLPELQKELQFTWIGIKYQKNNYYPEQDFREEVAKAIHFFKSSKNENGELAKLAEDSQCGPMRFRDNVNKVGTGPKNEIAYYGAVLFMAFGNYSAFEIIKSQKKGIDKKRKDWGEEGQPVGYDLEGDPLELSRGERKYVFKYFTALQDWNGLWEEFDQLAFQEALKTLNQFQDKESKRKEELEQIEKCRKWMEDGVSDDGKPAKIYVPGQEEDEDGEERGSLPVFKGDKRWERLQCILEEQLAIKNDFTSDELRDYGLSERTVRGAKDIFRKWNQVLAKSKNTEACLPELRNILKKYQKENQKIIGSVNLFNELLKPDNFCIWDESYEVNHNSHASKNILEDAVIYYEYCARVKELKEPIKFTPADARYSRRLADLKCLISTGDDGKKMQWKNGYGVMDSGDILVVRLAAKDGNTGKWDMAKIGLHFSAPRLKRDQLISCGMPAYCPPLAQALNPENVSNGKTKLSLQIKKAAVQLMPDFDRKGKLRFLLNFQPEVDVADIKKSAGAFFAADQFYGGVKQKIGLLWPDEKKDMVKWHKDGKAFNVVSVDLGQRTCGALSRIEVSPKKQDRAFFVGNDGSRDWFAKRTFAQLLRLNGEDCRNGNGNEEPYGSAGRPATPAETAEGEKLCIDMLGDRGKELWVKGIDSSGMLLYERYFPAQNDKLLFVFRKALWRLRMLSRWHNFINEGRADDVEMESREAEWLNDKPQNGIEELEKSLRSKLPELLLRITGRILPLRGRHWKLHYRNGGFELQQSETDALAEHSRICGQRGLSFARLEQLEKLRTCFQSLNRIIMEEPGSKRKTSRELREWSVPDCCPDILDRLDELKKQRVNQTANLILAHALGMRHKIHDPATKCIRIENDIHGEYERIPGVEPAKFIVLENLSRYRFSQGRTKFENSRLMMWAHRAIRDKLVELCEVFGLTVLEVNAGYSSKFTPDGVPGFRAEEVPAQRVLNSKAAKFLKDRGEFSREYEQLVRIVELADKQGKTVLVPKEGGSIFVPFVPQDSDRHLEQADLNASYNIGLRGIAHPNNVLVHNKLLVSKDKRKKGIWTPSISSKRRKEIFKDKKFSIEGLDKDKDTINLFLTGCQCEELGQISAITDDEELRSYRGRWMVGGGIFKDVKREFERCLRINLKRMGG